MIAKPWITSKLRKRVESYPRCSQQVSYQNKRNISNNKPKTRQSAEFWLLNSIFHNVEKCPSILYKSCGVYTTRFLEYLSSFFYIMIEKLKKDWKWQCEYLDSLPTTEIPSLKENNRVLLHKIGRFGKFLQNSPETVHFCKIYTPWNYIKLPYFTQGFW